MAIFWTFGLSLLGISIIFGNKLYELSRRRETFITRILSRYDTVLEKIMLRMYFSFKKFEDWVRKHTSVTFPNFITRCERKFINWISDTSARFIHFWRGKKEILPRAKVSKFIASVLEYRYHSERERKKLMGKKESI